MQQLQGRVRSWASKNTDFLVDLAIVAGLVFLAVTEPFYEVSRGQPSPFSAREFDLVLAPLEVLPLLFRRKAPIAALVIITTAFFGAPALSHFSVLGSLGAYFALFVAIFSVAQYRPLVVSIPALAGVILAPLALNEIRPPTWDQLLPTTITMLVLPGVAAWVGGLALRLRAIRRREFARRAAIEEAQREEAARNAIAEERARQAAVDERARIARELHDVVAHSLSVMVVQAGAARRVLDADSDEAKKSIRAIEATGREALVEMRRLLGIVRKQNGKHPARAPQPGIDELESMLATVRQAGVDVSLEVEGNRTPLSPGLSLAVYRVVQEALTNVLKHSQAHKANVHLKFQDGSLQVRVRDDGRGQVVFEGEKPTGYGLVGLKERVVLFGGEVAYGNLPDRTGFCVSAKLPLTSAK